MNSELINDIFKNMSQEELEQYQQDPNKEPYITIDSKRNVHVPDELKCIGVEGDTNVEYVNILMPRYWDGLDFYQLQQSINYVTSDGVVG